MDKIALIIGNRVLYWYPIILILAAAAACAAFLYFSAADRHSFAAAAASLFPAVVLSIVLSRLIHWYCRTNSYAGFAAAMTDYSSGGFALIGIFAGCLLTAGLMRALRICRDLPRVLDAMSLSGCLGITLGRLAFLFSTTDRGALLSGNVLLPQLCRIINSVSGAEEYRLPVFFLQAVYCGVLFTVLLFLRGRRNMRPGRISLLFLLFYSAGQILWDSMRTDSIYFRSNGFVSVVQIASLIAIVGVAALFSIKPLKELRALRQCIPLWIVAALCLGGAGFMEYYVQRHGSQAVFAYSVMAVCLAGACVFITGLCLTERKAAHRSSPPEAA